MRRLLKDCAEVFAEQLSEGSWIGVAKLRPNGFVEHVAPGGYDTREEAIAAAWGHARELLCALVDLEKLCAEEGQDSPPGAS